MNAALQWKPEWYQKCCQTFVNKLYTLRDEVGEENVLKILEYFVSSLTIIEEKFESLSSTVSNSKQRGSGAVEFGSSVAPSANTEPGVVDSTAPTSNAEHGVVEFKYEVSPSSIVHDLQSEAEAAKELLQQTAPRPEIDADTVKELLDDEPSAVQPSPNPSVGTQSDDPPKPPKKRVKKKPTNAKSTTPQTFEFARAKKEYNCETCGAIYTNRTSLFNHKMRKHRATVQCTLCATLVLAERMDAHMEKHAKNDPIVKCTDCDKTFKNRRDYQNHYQRNHKPENWVVCDMCGKSVYKFAMQGHLDGHKLKDPNFVPPEEFRCKICGVGFISKTRLTMHTRTVHKPHDLICSHCGRAFKYKRQFQEHEAMHTGTPLYSCETCGEKFIKARRLETHKRIHDAVRPHKCNYCEKAFFGKYQLSQHMNSHTGERPFVCKYCGLSYTTGASMHTHIRIKHKWDGKLYDARRRKRAIRPPQGETEMEALMLPQHLAPPGTMMPPHMGSHQLP
ncbi:unnamed protein product [Cyprideis torosa]|uniref:Uncharacterized protein n=1 Tax=Cyprideis torosa TaxID=163714 RepID=A0A7R8ZNP5_9CRUS|nr:unnamed protein product [Cyprideis torosa]CAG0888193.1 unnamed protein product [Cyprideis torosa]